MKSEPSASEFVPQPTRKARLVVQGIWMDNFKSAAGERCVGFDKWDDSNDGSPDTISFKHAIQQSSSKRVQPSPLQVHKMVKRRRRARKWSLDEEETLKIGVKEFGKGCWKQILDHYRDEFDGRTDVDLKDKWRNMNKNGKPVEEYADECE